VLQAAADWAANKTIALPDYRGRAMAGLDDMGNTAAGRLTSTYFGTAATVLGAAGGSESTTLTLLQLPTGITSLNASFNISVSSTQNTMFGGFAGSGLPGGSQTTIQAGSYGPLLSTGSVAANSVTSTSSNTGGTAHRTASPMMLATIYIKL
jgi:microcystin-dependent protein